MHGTHEPNEPPMVLFSCVALLAHDAAAGCEETQAAANIALGGRRQRAAAVAGRCPSKSISWASVEPHAALPQA